MHLIQNNIVDIFSFCIINLLYFVLFPILSPSFYVMLGRHPVYFSPYSGESTICHTSQPVLIDLWYHVYLILSSHIHLGHSFWAFFSVPSVHLTVFVQISHCLGLGLFLLWLYDVFFDRTSVSLYDSVLKLSYLFVKLSYFFPFN